MGGGGGGFGGGGFGGGGGGMSMHGMGSMGSFGGGSSFRGMGSGMSNFSSGPRNAGSLGNQFSAHDFSSAHQFSGQQFSGSNRANFQSNFNASGLNKGLSSSFANSARLNPQHASWNQNWQHGEHLSQLNNNHFNNQFAHNGLQMAC